VAGPKGEFHPNFPGIGLKNGIAEAKFIGNGQRVLTFENCKCSITLCDADKGIPSIQAEMVRDRPKVRVWDASAGRELVALNGDDEILTADCSQDGEHVATATRQASGRFKICLWEVTSGKNLFTLEQQAPCPFILCSADGQRVLGLRQDQVRIWDVQGAEVGCFDAPENGKRETLPVTFAAISPDGRLAAAVCGTEVRIWDVTTGQALSRLLGHQLAIHSAHFSADGKRVVTASTDETARVWESATGVEVYTLRGHNGVVHDACFSPDGQTVATSSADGTARLWRMELLSVAKGRKPRELTPQERRQFEIGR
jgi:WD40 repeat protein